MAGVSAAHAARVAAEVFGVEGTAEPLPGERDLNFRLRSPAGDAVLKLHALDAERADVELENRALRHLAATRAARLVPRVLRSRQGEDVVRVDAGDGKRFARMLRWLPGTVLAESAVLPDLEALGRAVARLDAALGSFTHPRARRGHRWSLPDATQHLENIPLVAEPRRRELARAALERFRDEVAPRLGELAAQPIHNDANDRNVLVDDAGRTTGIVDFGDLVSAPRVCGLAVACAYAMLDRPSPVRAVLPLVAGYHGEAALAPLDAELLLDLVRTRLAVSVCMAAVQTAEQPDNAYLLVSQEPVVRLLERLELESAPLAHLRFRGACDLEPSPRAEAVRAWLAATRPAPVLRDELAGAPRLILDWSSAGGAPELERMPDAAAATRVLFERMAAAGAAVGVGRYLEERAVYRSDAFSTDWPGERRTLHLGVDLFVAAGEPVRTPLDGIVRAVAVNDRPLDYGPVVILEHETADGVPFWTLYGHLQRASTDGLRPGARLASGDVVARVGDWHENGGWPPHLHLQLLTELLDMETDVPGVGTRAEAVLWRSVSPNPNLLLRHPEGVAAG